MKEKNTIQFLQILAVVVCLFIFGEYFITKTLADYREYDLKRQDEELENVLDSVDSNINDFLTRYLEELGFMTSREGFEDAEQKFVQQGEAKDLLIQLKEYQMGKEKTFKSIFVVFHDQVILSTDGKLDYWIPEVEKDSPENALAICTDEELNPYIAFIHYHKDMTYVAVMDPLVFYERIEDTSGLKVMGKLMLIDKDHSMFIYRKKKKVKAEIISDEGSLENPLVQTLLYAHMRQLETFDSYEMQESSDKESYNVRVAICPDSLTQNKLFSIGIIHDDLEEKELIQNTVFKIMFYGGLIFIGIIILICYLMWVLQQDARNRRKMAILKQKAEAVEALNAQTMELAHHQRLETIGQLTSGVAHEFNNLLTPIMGYSLMTIENLSPDDTESYDNLLEIYEAAQKAKTLISRLSDLSRKNTAVTMNDINPNVIVEKALAMVITSKPENIKIVQTLTCKDVFLHGNETQLTQLMMNLILNAFHAISEKEGTIYIDNYVKEDYICFDIKDTGEGMTEEVKKKLFDPFFTTKEQGRGTGLGLAIVMQTVEEHKGKIRVNSQLGKGSTFYLSFPMVKK